MLAFLVIYIYNAVTAMSCQIFIEMLRHVKLCLHYIVLVFYGSSYTVFADLVQCYVNKSLKKCILSENKRQGGTVIEAGATYGLK